jgi:hypothetical protein
MTCESINDDIFNRKYKESIQKSRKQKCESRKFHPHYPCESIHDDSGKYLHCKSRLLKYDTNSFLVKNIQPRIVYLRPYSEQFYEIHKEDHKDHKDKENLLHAVQTFFKDRYDKRIEINLFNPTVVCSEVSQLKNDNNQKERFDYDSEILYDTLERVCRFSDNIQNTEEGLLSSNTEKKMYFNEVWNALHIIAIKLDTLVCLWFNDKWTYVFPRKDMVSHDQREYSVSQDTPIVILHASLAAKGIVEFFRPLYPKDKYFKSIINQFSVQAALHKQQYKSKYFDDGPDTQGSKSSPNSKKQAHDSATSSPRASTENEKEASPPKAASTSKSKKEAPPPKAASTSKSKKEAPPNIRRHVVRPTIAPATTENATTRANRKRNDEDSTEKQSRTKRRKDAAVSKRESKAAVVVERESKAAAYAENSRRRNANSRTNTPLRRSKRNRGNSEDL